MYPAPFRFHRVATLAEATSVLNSLGESAKLIAGGQTLLPLMKLRLMKPTDLVDVVDDAPARTTTMNENRLRWGALVTHAQAGHCEWASRYPIIRDCALGIADAQVRAMGTIGGSLAEADPSSCWPTLLNALDAVVHCVGPHGKRVLSVAQLLAQPYAPALHPYELIEAVSVSPSALDGVGAFVAFKRSAPAYPTASCALQVRFDGQRCQETRLALGCVNLTPLRIEVGDLIGNQILSQPLIDAVAQRASEQCDPFADNKGSAEYKRALVAGLVRRAFAVVQCRKYQQPAPPTHTYYG